MKNILMKDSAAKPQLFIWNGSISRQKLQVWLTDRNLNLPQDLIELWEIKGGGDLFESETILSPFGDANLGDDMDSVNQFHHRQGMGQQYLVFHVGTGMTAVRLSDGFYVKLDDSYQELSEFPTLEDWYVSEIRSEYGKHYHMDIEALNGTSNYEKPLAKNQG